MKVIIAFLAALLTAQVAVAQSRGSFTGPFTGYEADELSEAWPEIRQAESFEDINWRAHGMSRPPGSPDAQRFLASNWDELRREQRFADIDWEYYGDRYDTDDRYARSRAGRAERSSRTERYGRAETGFPEFERDSSASPFTREESAALSRAWGQIREAARFEDINWRAMGFSGAPGDRQARQLMSRNWGQLREAGRFEDIDWQAITGYRGR